MTVTGILALAACWVLLGAVRALTNPAPRGGCCEYSQFTNRKVRLRYFAPGHTEFPECAQGQKSLTGAKCKYSVSV